MSDQQHHYARDGICTACETTAPCLWIAERAARQWRELADAFEPLHAYLEPGRSGSNGVTRRPPASKPPSTTTASDLLEEIESWARFYALTLMDETHDYTPPADVPGRLRDIARRHGHFTSGEDERWVEHKRDRDPNMPPGHWHRVALDYCDFAHTLHARAVALISQPPPPRFMGPCMADQCDGDVYLRAGEHVARCRTCDQGHDAGELHEQLTRALESRLLRRHELRDALNIVRKPGTKRVSPGLLRLWIHRGRLVPIIRDPELFRLTDAMDLAGIDRAA